MQSPYAARTQREMTDVLMDPTASAPAIHYYMIRGGVDKKNITVWETGTVGGEYIKTYGHYHIGDVKETYTVISGDGIVILQVRAKDKNGVPIDDEIESFRAIRVKKGDAITIPPHAGHLGINIGSEWFVTLDDSIVNLGEKNAVSAPSHADYSQFKKLHGAAYYVVSKNGSPTLVKNPHYKKVPPAEIK
ncbi:MAG TPA: glucose-6-phosphate isomerase family protein [Candidatus Paceibacterota bacterium]|nr:glucose-6-phosphate isomerase family protein [Candidatus Paceibacterota bacterium]